MGVSNNQWTRAKNHRRALDIRSLWSGSFMAVSSEVWLPIATFVLGSLSQIVGEAIRDRRRCRREDALRERDLAAQREEQRAAARCAELAALKEHLLTLNRAVT